MVCSRVQNLLSAYLDRELSGEEMLQIRGHLSHCPVCEQELVGLRQIKSLLGALPAAETARPLDLSEVAVDPIPVFIRRFRRWLGPGFQLENLLQFGKTLLGAPVSPLTVGLAVGGVLIGVALLRPPQVADAVSARVPEWIPVEYAAAPYQPTLAVLTSPEPNSPAIQVVLFPAARPRSHPALHSPHPVFGSGLPDPNVSGYYGYDRLPQRGYTPEYQTVGLDYHRAGTRR